MSEGTKNWYVLNTYSGHEAKVKVNLERRIESMGVEDLVFAALVPTEEVVEIKGGKRNTVERKTYPGYILVEMILTPESWFVVRNTPGVLGFVGATGTGGIQAIPLSKTEVDQILGKAVAAPVIVASFTRGEAVRIKDGPFAEFVGSVDDVHPDRQKLRVLVSIFGRETPVELDFLQVEKL